MQLSRRTTIQNRPTNCLQRNTNRLIRFTIRFSTRYLRRTLNKISNKAIHLQRRLISRPIRLNKHHREFLHTATRSLTNSLTKRPFLPMYTRCTCRLTLKMLNRSTLHNRKLTSIRTRIRQHIIHMKRTTIHLVSLRTQRARVRRRHVRPVSTLIIGRLTRHIRYNISECRTIQGSFPNSTLNNRNRYFHVPISTRRTNLQHNFRRNSNITNRARHTISHSKSKILRHQNSRQRTLLGRC